MEFEIYIIYIIMAIVLIILKLVYLVSILSLDFVRKKQMSVKDHGCHLPFLKAKSSKFGLFEMFSQK